MRSRLCWPRPVLQQLPWLPSSVKSCAYQAKADYNKAYYSLLQRGPMTSLPDIIAQRRFFCLRFVRCSVDDVDSLEFRGAFNRCLQDEPPEKYDAEQHD